MNETKNTEPLPVGHAELTRWIDAMICERKARSALESAVMESSDAVNALAKALLPADAKVGEPFNVFVSGGVLCLTKGDRGGVLTRWRVPPVDSVRAALGLPVN